MHRWELLSVLLATLVSLAEATCWLKNGTDRNSLPPYPGGDWYNPCDSTIIGHSTCCNNKGSGDRCAPIGSLAQSLCFNQYRDQLWRESCTDQSWTSSNCVKLFLNVSDTDVTVTNCSTMPGHGDGFCYGTGNWGCCLAGQAVFIDPKTGNQVNYNPALTSTSSVSPSATSSSPTISSATSISGLPSTSAATSASSSSATSTAVPNSAGLSTGAKAGIGVAVGLGVLLLLGMGVFFFVRRNNRHKTDYKVAPHPGAVELDKSEKLELQGTPQEKSPVSQTAARYNDYSGARTIHQNLVEMGP